MANLLILNRHQKRHWQSFAMALGIEFLLAMMVAGWTLQHLPTMRTEVIPLSIEMLMDEPSQAMVTPKPSPQTPAKPNPKITPSPRPDTPQTVAQPTLGNESHAAPSVMKETSANAMPSHAPQAVTPTIDPALAYNVKLAAAVQAAFEVPGSAKALSFKGKARVEFNLHDGVASAIRVVQSSGLGAVDRAAVKAVEIANFPLPPAELKSKEGIYQIWVACF
jgi:protein TonB